MRKRTPAISLAIAWKAPPSTRRVIGSTSMRFRVGGPGCLPTSYWITLIAGAGRLRRPRNASLAETQEARVPGGYACDSRGPRKVRSTFWGGTDGRREATRCSAPPAAGCESDEREQRSRSHHLFALPGHFRPQGGNGQVAEAVDVRGDPGWDHGRRVVLVDDRRPLQAVPRPELLAGVVAGRHRAQR